MNVQAWQAAQTSNWVGTFSGKRIDLRNPDPRQISLFDIAQALGNQCRFTGQVRDFYSVAEHCIHAAELVPPEFRLAALLHDAQEAYIADLSTPMKAEVGPSYREIENRIVIALDERFSMNGQLIELPECVKVADRRMLMTERDALFDNYEDWGPGFEEVERHPGFKHTYYNPAKARKAYWDAVTIELLARMEA